jgi:hypothetical protein
MMRRPRSLTFLCIILLGQSLFNLLGAVEAYQRWAFLSQQPLSVSPIYLGISDAVWAATFAVLTGGLWRRAGWARRTVLVAYPLYLAHGWLNRLFFAQANFVPTTYFWVAGVEAGMLVMIWLILMRPAVRGVFHLKTESVQSNPNVSRPKDSTLA